MIWKIVVTVLIVAAATGLIFFPRPRSARDDGEKNRGYKRY